MNFLKLLLSFILINVFCDILFYLLGRSFYCFGKRKIGHYFVGISIASDFGNAKKTRKWLFDKCPYEYNCNTCKIWTCANYCAKHNDIPSTEEPLRSVGIKIISSA